MTCLSPLSPFSSTIYSKKFSVKYRPDSAKTLAWVSLPPNPWNPFRPAINIVRETKKTTKKKKKQKKILCDDSIGLYSSQDMFATFLSRFRRRSSLLVIVVASVPSVLTPTAFQVRGVGCRVKSSLPQTRREEEEKKRRTSFERSATCWHVDTICLSTHQ